MGGTAIWVLARTIKPMFTMFEMYSFMHETRKALGIGIPDPTLREIEGPRKPRSSNFLLTPTVGAEKLSCAATPVTPGPPASLSGRGEERLK